MCQLPYIVPFKNIFSIKTLNGISYYISFQSAQTNGDRNFNRKLTKSYSELYQCNDTTREDFCDDGDDGDDYVKEKHDTLLRTQSEEPTKYFYSSFVLSFFGFYFFTQNLFPLLFKRMIKYFSIRIVSRIYEKITYENLNCVYLTK